MTSQPLYQVDQEVYVRSSAARGMVESLFISGVYQRGTGWMYTIRTGRRAPYSPHIYGNQQDLALSGTLYLSEDELILKCQAYHMAEVQAKLAYLRVRNMRLSYCPDAPETYPFDI